MQEEYAQVQPQQLRVVQHLRERNLRQMRMQVVGRRLGHHPEHHADRRQRKNGRQQENAAHADCRVEQRRRDQRAGENQSDR